MAQNGLSYQGRHKMKKLITIVLGLFLATNANASSTREIIADTITNTTGGSSFSVPSVGAAIVTDTGTVALTNKTMSGASNTFSNIPVGAIGNGSVLSGTNTGDVTIGTANGLSLSSQALSLQLADTTHTGALAFGDYVTFSNGTARGSSGTRASPTAITAGTGVVFSGTAYANVYFIQGNGGAVTVTANPQISAATNVGQELILIGRSATNTVTLSDGTGLSLNGPVVLGLDSIITLVWDSTNWVEKSRR